MGREIRVMAPCPVTDRLVPTEAFMTQRRLQRFRGGLFFWCPHCRRGHAAEAGRLELAALPATAPALAATGSKRGWIAAAVDALREGFARFLFEEERPRDRAPAAPLDRDVAPSGLTE